jgi:hypothetical protein
MSASELLARALDRIEQRRMQKQLVRWLREWDGHTELGLFLMMKLDPAWFNEEEESVVGGVPLGWWYGDEKE